jgi:hypothetical protein
MKACASLLLSEDPATVTLCSASARDSSSRPGPPAGGGSCPGAGGLAQVAHELQEAVVVVHQQDAGRLVAHHPESVRYPARHGQVAGLGEQHLVPASDHHLPVQQERVVVQVVVQVQGRSGAGRQRHLQHHRTCAGCRQVLHDEGVQEPPRLSFAGLR